MQLHYTHNVSYSSSDAQYKKMKSNDNTSSSEKEYLERNKTENDWSRILIINNSKEMSKRILSEEDLKITIKSNEEKNKEIHNKENNEKLYKNIGKYKDKYRVFNFKNKRNNKTNKIIINNRFGKKFRILNNGILLKNMNKLKKENKNKFQVNEYIISKGKKYYNNIKPLNTNIIPNNIIKEDKNINLKNENENLLLEKPVENNHPDSFHVMFIKRPKRSFITKICQYKNQSNKKIKEFKRLNSSSGFYNKKKPNSCRLTPITTMPEDGRKKSKSKIIHNKIPKLIENNTDNKLASLSTTSNKKYTINSNASLFLNRSNYLLKNNNFLQRPLSSVKVIRKEININFKSSKTDNNYNNTMHNKSYNMPKTRFISSIMSTNTNKSSRLKINESKNIMYENRDFMKQFRELKYAFDFYSTNNNNLKDDNYYDDNNYNSYRENLEYIYMENYNNDKKVIRKLNSAKVRSNSYQMFYPKEISPLFDYKNRNRFEEEKQSKANNDICSKCGYQKHFGNEKKCPICVNLKENNIIREENLSNKKYYYPFRDKYETDYSVKKTYRNHCKIFNHIYNTNNDNREIKIIHNPYCINNGFNSLGFKRKKDLDYKRRKRNRSHTNEKYSAIKKYFV